VKRNAGVEKRIASDLHLHESEKKRARSGVIVENLRRKAEIYERQKEEADPEGGGGLIDFGKKREEECQDEFADITDEFGRVKTVKVDSRVYREYIANAAREATIMGIDCEVRSANTNYSGNSGHCGSQSKTAYVAPLVPTRNGDDDRRVEYKDGRLVSHSGYGGVGGAATGGLNRLTDLERAYNNAIVSNSGSDIKGNQNANLAKNMMGKKTDNNENILSKKETRMLALKKKREEMKK